MSLVIGIKCKDGVVLGSDSIIVINEDNIEQVECESTSKTWRPSVYRATNPLLPQAPRKADNILMGGVGTVRDSNVVKSQLTLPEVINARVIIDKVIPDIRSILINNGFISDNKPYESMDSSFIVATVDSLFILAQDYSVVEKKNIAVIGYCENEAKNIIRQLIKDDDVDDITLEEAKSIITEVITNCSLSCTYVGLPIQFKSLLRHKVEEEEE
jgi:20S proteasome alpha/beta subunit